MVAVGLQVAGPPEDIVRGDRVDEGGVDVGLDVPDGGAEALHLVLVGLHQFGVAHLDRRRPMGVKGLGGHASEIEGVPTFLLVVPALEDVFLHHRLDGLFHEAGRVDLQLA